MSLSNKFMSHLRFISSALFGATVVFTGITAYANQDRLFSTFLMPVVRLLPADTSNSLALLACKYRLLPASNYMDNINLQTTIFGRPISNPIGIAAGFDKNGEAVVGLKDLGFGFIEIGSVTPLAQKSVRQSQALHLSHDMAMNIYFRFESEGHQAVAQRLRKTRTRSDFEAVVGVNLESGHKSRDPIKDYVAGIKTFGPVADYLVVNMNSLEREERSQSSKAKLIELLTTVNKTRESSLENNVPLLLKISPDITQSDMKDIASVISMKKCRVDGLIVCNSTVARDKRKIENASLIGQPLKDRSTRLIAQMFSLTKGKTTIIGVGGVASGVDAFEKIEAGASCVQVYAALVNEGPDLIERIKEELSMQLTKNNFANVQKAVGSNYKKYLSAN